METPSIPEDITAKPATLTIVPAAIAIYHA
jgi:hypothetical protein